MTDRAILQLLAHLEAKQLASDFLLEVLLGHALSKNDAIEREELIAKISMLSRDRTTFAKNASSEDIEWLEMLKPDIDDHVARMCRRIAARAEAMAHEDE